MKISLVEEMKRIDRLATDTFGIPEIILMENAGRAAAGVVAELIGNSPGKTVCVLAGSGNNGGDAFAAARHLSNRGVNVRAYFTGNAGHTKDAARINRQICEKLGIPVLELGSERDWEKLSVMLSLADAILDGILGTGFKGPLRGAEERLIRMVNESGRPTVSIDLPSGVDADTGCVLGEAVRADVTVTFGLPKIGHFFCPGAEATGRLVVDDISLPAALLSDKSILQEYLSDDVARALLVPRPIDSHKGSCGRVLIAAGSRGMTGAASLAARAVLRSGAGIAALATADGIVDVLAEKLTEVITCPLPEIRAGVLGDSATDALMKILPKFDTVLMGPGLGRAPETGNFIRRVAARIKVPLVLDADALYAFRGHTDEIKHIEGEVVLTPHLGEMADLLGITVPSLRSNLIAHTRKAAAEWQAVIVLKSECTVVAYPDGRIFFTSKGNPSMATAGSGDVLAGTIAGLVRQVGIDAAPLVGEFLHGLAGDLAEKEKSIGLIAGDILEKLPEARRLLEAGEL